MKISNDKMEKHHRSSLLHLQLAYICHFFRSLHTFRPAPELVPPKKCCYVRNLFVQSVENVSFFDFFLAFFCTLFQVIFSEITLFGSMFAALFRQWALFDSDILLWFFFSVFCYFSLFFWFSSVYFIFLISLSFCFYFSDFSQFFSSKFSLFSETFL